MFFGKGCNEYEKLKKIIFGKRLAEYKYYNLKDIIKKCTEIGKNGVLFFI